MNKKNTETQVSEVVESTYLSRKRGVAMHLYTEHLVVPGVRAVLPTLMGLLFGPGLAYSHWIVCL